MAEKKDYEHGLNYVLPQFYRQVNEVDIMQSPILSHIVQICFEYRFADSWL